ncbi:MAG: T9SS type A sorting domain-containing protein [Bacteroidia bacterium]
MKKLFLGLFILLSSMAMAQQDTIIGPAEVCPNTSGHLYFIPDSLNSSSIVTWNVSPGLNITSGQNTDSIFVNADSLFYSGTISASFDSITLYFNVYSTPQTLFSISGPSFGLCVTQGSYHVDTVPETSYYNWSVPSGATILSGQGTQDVTIDFGSGFTNGVISVTVSNACSGTATSYYSVNAAPQSVGFISGPTEGLCPSGTFTAAYKANTVPGATSYSWLVPAGITITYGLGTDSINVSVDSTFTSGIMAVYATNACGTSDSTQIFLNSAPQVYYISGPTSELCPLVNGIVSYYAYANSSSAVYNWTVPSGATIISGQGTSNVLVSFDSTFSSGNISVIPTNACGTGSSVSLALSSLPLQPGSISGQSDSLCTNIYYTYQLDSAFNSTFTYYAWIVPPGASVVAGQGTVQITVVYDNTSAGGTIYVYALNGCGTSDPSTFTIGTPTPFETPGAIHGPTTGICYFGTSTATYYIDTTVSGVTQSWTVPPGMTILSGQGTDSIFVSVDSSFVTGTISVVNIGECGTSTPSQITINSTLSAPSINGQDYNLCHVTAPVLYYSNPVAGATTYTWTLPAGASIVSGQGTDSIYVSYDSTFFSGIISVIASAGCDISNPAQIAVNAVPLMSQGGITGPHNNMCGITSAQYYVLLPSEGATSFTWTVPAGMTIVYGMGTDSISVSIDTTVFNGGVISITADNACGSSSALQEAIQFGFGPAFFNGPYENLCNYYNTTTTYTLSGNGINSVFWTVPDGFTIIDGQGTSYLTVFIDSTFTSGQMTMQITGECNSGTSSILLEAIPAAPDSIAGPSTVCPGYATSYNLPNTGGQGTYTWIVPPGMNIISGQGTWFIEVSFDFSFTGGTMYVYKTNDCGNGAVASFHIGTYPTPSAPASISGPGCLSGISAAGYTATSVAGPVTYNWEVPAGASILYGYGTDSIYVSFDSTFTSGNLNVSVTNPCDAHSAVTTLFLNSVAAKPGPVSGDASICKNATGLVYSISAVTRATSYAWSVPAGASIVSGQGTTSVTVNWGSSSGFITVVAVNGCGNSQVRNKHVATHNCHTPGIASADENDVVMEINLYPNPTTGSFTLNVNNVINSDAHVRITNLLGETIYTSVLNTVNGKSIDLSGFGRGMYLLQITDGSSNYYKKVVVQ